MSHHSRDCLMKDLIGKGDDQILRTSFNYGTTIRKLLERTNEIAASNNAREISFLVDDERSLAM